MNPPSAMDSKKHDHGPNGYSSNSDEDDDDDCGIQHLEPLPLLALSHHRCDSVLLQAFNQVIARVNAQQQLLDELCDHLYVQSGDAEDGDEDAEDADYPTDEADEVCSTGTSDSDDDNDTGGVNDRRACTPQDHQDDDDLVSADDETANALVAERLLELAAFAFTPRYRRQQPPGRGSHPQ